jgi:hypothetical protein
MSSVDASLRFQMLGGTRRTSLMFFLALSCFAGDDVSTQSKDSGNTGGQADKKSLTFSKYARLPLSFERRGDSEFVARGQAYTVDLRAAQAMVSLPGSGEVGLEFVHARPKAAVPQKELPGKVNYIHGNDPRRWQLGLSTYERVTYPDLYPGIDVVYYGNQKQLEFD